MTSAMQASRTPLAAAGGGLDAGASWARLTPETEASRAAAARAISCDFILAFPSWCGLTSGRPPIVAAAARQVHPGRRDPCDAAQRFGRQGVEGVLLFGTQHRVEGLDGVGALLELGLTLGDVLRHHGRHLVETFGGGQLGEVVMTVRTRAARPPVMIAVRAFTHVIAMRLQRREQSLQGGVLIWAQLQQVMEMFGLQFLMLVDALLDLGFPGRALFGGGRATGRRLLRQGEGGNRSEGRGGDQACDGAGGNSHVGTSQC